MFLHWIKTYSLTHSLLAMWTAEEGEEKRCRKSRFSMVGGDFPQDLDNILDYSAKSLFSLENESCQLKYFEPERPCIL